MVYTSAETTVVLLAAGHGKRMLPLTETTPKPLLKVGDKCLIEHHLIKLHLEGFRNIVINLAYKGDQIRSFLGDGGGYGMHIKYSDEMASGALETAGGLRHALPLIESDPFLTVNADIWTDYPFSRLLRKLDRIGRLVMVDNPAHNESGDFCIDPSSKLLTNNKNGNNRTFSGIGLYRKKMICDLKPEPQALAPIFQALISEKKLEGEYYDGKWLDIGTPERLQQLNESFKNG